MSRMRLLPSYLLNLSTILNDPLVIVDSCWPSPSPGRAEGCWRNTVSAPAFKSWRCFTYFGIARWESAAAMLKALLLQCWKQCWKYCRFPRLNCWSLRISVEWNGKLNRPHLPWIFGVPQQPSGLYIELEGEYSCRVVWIVTWVTE